MALVLRRRITSEKKEAASVPVVVHGPRRAGWGLPQGLPCSLPAFPPGLSPTAVSGPSEEVLATSSQPGMCPSQDGQCPRL